MAIRDRDFAHGFSVAGVAGAMLLALVFVVAAPTGEYRARAAFLMHSGGLQPVAFVFGAFEAAALLALAATSWRLMTWRATLGASAASVVLALAVYVGVFRHIVPEFPESPTRWVVFAICVAAAVALLLRHRTRLRGHD